MEMNMTIFQVFLLMIQFYMLVRTLSIAYEEKFSIGANIALIIQLSFFYYIMFSKAPF